MIDDFFQSIGVDINQEITDISFLFHARYFNNPIRKSVVLAIPNNSVSKYTLVDYPEGSIDRVINSDMVDPETFSGFSSSVVDLSINTGLTANKTGQFETTFMNKTIAIVHQDEAMNLLFEYFLTMKNQQNMKQEIMLGIKSLLYALFQKDLDMVFYIIKSMSEIKQNIVSENDRDYYYSNVDSMEVKGLEL